MIGWLLIWELARERRVRRERLRRERDLEAQAERQRRRAPEPGVESEPIEDSCPQSPAIGISDGKLAVGLAILLSPIGYIFGATPYLIVGLIVGIAVVVGHALISH